MTPERFSEIERLFNEALPLAGGERGAFLAAQCGADVELRAEVEALLEADGNEAGSRVAGAIEEAAAALPANPHGSDAGVRLGPYLLVRELGRGGMGAVYQAIRSDGEFLQTVAIKLVKRGMDSDAIVQRFKAERQILAGLSHPNIGALLDGGTSPDGRPYLVMEYIEGQTLLEYADSLGLDIRARLDLFRPICRAVDYAHRSHVLHRDIKPANVMVTAEGVPKLLDFGIAKLLLPELVAGGAPPTETHARLMTPDFASPEQIRGEPLTQATDVYSLGVLLYRLLTGKQPQTGAGETAAPPSSAVSDTKLRSALAGDLDTIICMALRKEPERRYASAAEFEADIHRYLSGRPVRARPDMIAYRAKRWARKHGMLAAAAASVAIFAFAAVLQWRLREEAEPPEEALALCQRADTLLRGDVRATQPGQGLPAPLREAIALYTKATEVAPKYVPAWNGLANAAEFTIDYDSSRSGELQRLAERAARQALRLNPRSAAGHAVLGSLLLREWKFNEAAVFFGKASELDPEQPYVLSDYADCLALAGRREEAAQAIERNLRGREGLQTYGPNARASVILLSALAGHYRELGKVDLALESSRKAIRLQGDYGPARLQYGTTLERSGDLQGAEREYLAAHTMRPGDSRMIASLGHLYARQKRRAETQQMLDSLDALKKEGVAVGSALALVYAGMGDEERAIDALETAVRAHEPGAPQVFLDRRLRAVLGTPRALALAKQIGVTPVH